MKRIQKAMKMNKGVDIKISKSQIHKVARHGGSLWSSLAGVASKALPMVMPLVKKAAAPLLTGALCGLASLGVNKLFSISEKKGQTGGFLIPDSKAKQLIQYKDWLTAKQKQDILNALQTGSGVHIKPTKKQIGAGWGTILASIGIPMLLDAFTGKGLQVDRERSRRSLPVHVPKPTTQNVPSSAKQNHGGLVLPVDYRSPPFFGSWDQMTNNMLGYGKPKNKPKKKNHKKREKDS